nr:replication initiator [Microbacterium agarici]
MPIDLDAYDYEGQIRWHGALSRLWRSSVEAMRRRCPDAEYFAVREVQARMALHVHAVVRVPASTSVDAESMGRAARAATATHPVTDEVVEWGQYGMQDREIRPRLVGSEDVMPDMSRAAARIISYVGKALGYSLKDVTPGVRDGEATLERIEFVKRLRRAARLHVLCPDCPMGRPGDCPRRAHENLGYGGHVVTVSRTTARREGWSLSHLTRTRLREERKAWMEANQPEGRRGGLSDADVKLAFWLAEQSARHAWEVWQNRNHARAP